VTASYAREAGRGLRPGSVCAVAVARTVRALADADELPGKSDFEATVRRIGRAWVRRVTRQNLWVWYRIRDEELVLVTVTNEPPVPF
jgi:hypothetical protein